MKLCTDIHGAEKLNPGVFADPFTFPLPPPAGQSFHLNISLSTRWIGTKFGKDIHGFQSMNPNCFGDPFSFPLAARSRLWSRVKLSPYK